MLVVLLLFGCSVVSDSFVTLWTVVHQAPLSIGFTVEYWSGFPFPPPGDHLDPETEYASPMSPTLQTDSLTYVQTSAPVLNM